MASPQIYRFDGVTLDVAAMRLSRDGVELVLEPKSFRLLQFLAENPERVLSKEEIFRVVWQDTAVTDNALTRTIAQIRKALEDDPKNPRYIDTVPTVGYRFIGVLKVDQQPVSVPALPPYRSRRRKMLIGGIAFTVLAAATVALLLRPPKPVEAPPSAPIPLTTYRGSEIAPSFSPSGDQVAFVWNGEKEDNEDIYVKTLGSDATPLRLTTDTSPDRYPAWSPDGSTIAFPRFISGEQFELILIPALSPDGKTLLFLQHPAFNWGNLWTVHVDSNFKAIDAPRQFTAGDVLFRQGIWSADGTEIIARTASGALRMKVDGSAAPVSLTGPGTYMYSFALSARSKRFAYSVIRGDANIWRLDLSAKKPHPEPLIASTVRDVYPQYSPDGRHIAFHTNRASLDTSQIWISDANGKNARQLTFTKTGISGTAHWSPDGQTISFDSNVTGPYEIYTISADGGAVKQLSEGSYGNFDTSWSRDGKWLYYTSRASGRNESWKIPASGGAAQQITHNGSMMAVESLDGKTLYICKETGSGSIWEMPVDGGPEEQLTDSLYRSNFAVTRQGVYYMPAPKADGTSEIRFYSFATKKSTLILPIGVPEYGLDVSPDGRYLVYAQLDDPASDLMLIENFH